MSFINCEESSDQLEYCPF